MSAPRYYRLEVGGAPEFHVLPDGLDLPEASVEVDRLPGPFEDMLDGQWTIDNQGLANSRIPAAIINEARALKYLEALLIKSGVDLATGLLKLEAGEKSVSIDILADEVLAKRAEFVRCEVERQRGQSGDAAQYSIPADDPLALAADTLVGGHDDAIG